MSRAGIGKDVALPTQEKSGTEDNLVSGLITLVAEGCLDTHDRTTVFIENLDDTPLKAQEVTILLGVDRIAKG